MDAIGKTKQKIALADIVQLTSMHKVDPEIVKPVLDRLKGGVLKNEFYNMIFNQDKVKKG